MYRKCYVVRQNEVKVVLSQYVTYVQYNLKSLLLHAIFLECLVLIRIFTSRMVTYATVSNVPGHTGRLIRSTAGKCHRATTAKIVSSDSVFPESTVIKARILRHRYFFARAYYVTF